MAKPASGMYKTKARNLTEAQLKRAKGAKAATKRTVSIIDTSRATTGANKGYTLGPGGKRLTGTVVMANGDRAVYKGGKRVTNVPKSSMKDKTPTGGTKSRTVTGGSGSTDNKPTKRNAPALSMAERKKLQKGRSNWISGARRTSQDALSSAERKKLQEKMNSGKSTLTLPGGYTVPLSNKNTSKKEQNKSPKKGDRRRVGGAFGGYETFNGTRWVRG